MALGRNYDWYGAIEAYKEALMQYYRNMRPEKPDFLDYLLKAAPVAAAFVPGLGPMAKLGIAEGSNLLGSMKRGDPYQPDILGILKATMAPKLAQQERIGGVLEAGEGVLQPEDINKFGQTYPGWIDWDRIAGQIGEESPFPAGPMSVSGEAQKKLLPFFARSPENEAMRQFQMQRAMNLAYPQPKAPKVLIGEALWLKNHPGATHEDYLRATKGITQEFKEPSKETDPAAVKKSQRKVQHDRLKTKMTQKGQASLGPKEWETWRLLDAEFGKEEKPKEPTLTETNAMIKHYDETGQTYLRDQAIKYKERLFKTMVKGTEISTGKLQPIVNILKPLKAQADAKGMVLDRAKVKSRYPDLTDAEINWIISQL